MSDVLTITDLEIAKKHDTFHSEVITGRAGGLASGAEIDSATNAVTGQVQTTLPKALRDVGFKPASFNFVTGGTLGVADADKCIYNPAPAGDDNWYSWSGVLPHTVAPGADPTAVGSGYAPRTDVVLRDELASNGGANLVNSEYRKTFYLADAKWGLDPSVTADNTAALALIMQNCPDNTVLDFCGMELRVFANVPGIASSGATPATSKALPFAQCPAMDGKKNITLKNGVVYAANAGTSGTKMYFPSTLSFINCKNVHFDNFTAEGKGESWGDADASISLTKEQRLTFLAENGGHAVYFGRCVGVTGALNTRLCGSVAPMYFSSTDEVHFESPFSNPASLGYAAFAADAWVGTLAETGREKFLVSLIEPIARRETLFRREDGTTPVGSSTYCGKGGCLTEDPGIIMQTIGGQIENMYANGSAKVLGYAFGAASGGITTSVGARVRDCQEIGFMTWSANIPATLTIDDVDAETGLTGLLVDFKSFGKGYARITGQVKITNTRGWSGETNELNKTSLVACLKAASEMFVELGVSVHRDSNIYCLINNETRSCGGGVKFLYGDYTTNGYLMRSQGWGSGASGSRDGLVDCGSTFHDVSAVTEALIQYKNLSDAGVYTYIHHDMTKSKISAAATRPVDGYTVSGTNLDEFIRFAPPSFGAYVASSARVARDNTTVTCASVDGLSGANTLISFYVQANHDLGANSRVLNGSNLHRVLAGNGVFSAGTIKGGVKRQYIIEGDVRSQYTAGSTYTAIGS